ncbi:MAG: CPBP family intramembrane metalloprotease [Clostridia bacterium]|nr:CPBP family intramembrane metalloprotease [Clostridia bacterium]
MTREKRLLRWTLLALLSLTVLRWPVAAAVRAMLPDVTAAPAANYAAAIAQSLLMFALPGWLLLPRWETQPGDGKKPGVFVIALLAVLLLRAMVTPLHIWWNALLGAETSQVFLPADGWTRLLAVIALAVVPAICEELLFRGAVLTRLLQCASRRQSVLLTTLLFALMHGSLGGLPGHLLSGALFTLLMLHTGRLAVPMAAHALYNLSALYWPEAPALLPWICGAALTGVFAWLILRAPRGRERRIGLRDGLLAAGVLLVMAGQYLIGM